MDKVFAFIQARSTSTRLPNKVVLPFTDSPEQTILDHIFLRCRTVLPEKNIIFLIPKNDQPLKSFLDERKYLYFEGSEEDVRDRYIKAANYFDAEYIIRLTGDNPFIDTFHLQLLVESTALKNYDLASFKNLPLGGSGEIFTKIALETQPPGGITDYMAEHVSLHIKEYPEFFKVIKFIPILDNESQTISASIRITVDEKDDFLVAQSIYSSLKNIPNFSVYDLISLYKSNSDIFFKNKNVSQVTFKLPNANSNLNRLKISIFAPNNKEYGSGHFERSTILNILLQTLGFEVTLDRDFPKVNDSDFYIIDYRDIKVPEEFPIHRVLLLDNLNPDNFKYQHFLSLPHPEMKNNFDNILFSKSSIHFQDKSKSGNLILVYAGSLGSEFCDPLDDCLLKHFPELPILRIGGSNPNSNKIDYQNRLNRFEYQKLLSESNIFVTYYGQSIFEAALFKKKIILFSISEYHHQLAKFFSELYPAALLGFPEDFNNFHPENTSTILFEYPIIPKDGYLNLLSKIKDLINKL
ncbi:MAG: spore coat biosynthesis protein F [Leptospiraceae bacterium]|nr:spore coat biosynthesis protein F [Leptospiraceae bacterium]MCP5512078.1 spore coat biosynthesis protein F [Leptospiraceae bacterium]